MVFEVSPELRRPRAPVLASPVVDSGISYVTEDVLSAVTVVLSSVVVVALIVLARYLVVAVVAAMAAVVGLAYSRPVLAVQLHHSPHHHHHFVPVLQQTHQAGQYLLATSNVTVS